MIFKFNEFLNERKFSEEKRDELADKCQENLIPEEW